MNRFITSFLVGLTMLTGMTAAAAPRASPATPEELRPRLEVTTDSVQEALEYVGVKGWALHAGLALASGAQPDLQRMRSGLEAAVRAWKTHQGTYAAAVSLRKALDEHQQSVLVEVGLLLTPEQRADMMSAFTPPAGSASRS